MASKRSSAKSKQPAKQSSLLFSFDNVNESKLIEDFVEQSYLDYSMYVILDRALPRVADGLKPVQRRIVYAMSELGLNALAKYKKSARTVGDVIGKFHPHGDSAVYEAMVLMAQSFSYRHPLIDGQGNWGVQDDPKSFAAMRYTESKLTKYSEILLKEANLGTVDWRANFDGTMEEPAILPARLPNILLNGASGIAVGMATDIPPHNIREVVAACIHLLNNPKASTVELFDFIPAPDFPTRACIITPKQDLLAMYESGSGSVKQRSIWVQENANIIIQELPYHVSGSKVLEQIAAQIEAKKLPMVVNVRDESDHENPTRLVIEPRSNRIDIDQLMAHLFATTDLEKSYRINLNAIGLNGKPHVFNLRDILVEWLAYRKITVTRRMEYRLGKVEERLHILEGLLIAFLNIDEVIRIIRNEDEPKPVLMKTFKGLTEVQAESILNLRLRNLARLEEMKITNEQNELAKERDYLSGILKSPTKLKNLIIKELEEDAETHGDDRRSPLTSVNNEAKAFNEMDLISSEPVTIVLSSKGWIRAAKGHEVNAEELNYKDGDEYLCSVMGKTNDHLCVLDNTGRSYSIGAHTLPSARGFGEPLSSSVTPPAGATFIGMVMSANENDKVLVASNFGYGFIATVADFVAKNKKGKGLINCGKEAKALAPYLFKDASQSADQLVVVTSSDGYLLTFTADELPQLSKGKGNKLINIPAARLKSGEESVVATVVCNAGESVVIHSGKRFMKLSFADLAEYQSERAKRGKKLPKGFQQVQLVEVEKK